MRDLRAPGRPVVRRVLAPDVELVTDASGSNYRNTRFSDSGPTLITAGTAPYTGTGTFSKTAGSYSITVTDAHGCTGTTTGGVTQPSGLTATSSAKAGTRASVKPTPKSTPYLPPATPRTARRST